MRKITLFMLLLLSSYGLVAQVLNQPANWPNTDWVTSGTFTAASLLGDPAVNDSFTFDDDAAGSASDDDVATESPIIDLTAAFTAGETLIVVNADYTHRTIGGSILTVEYWDADASTWVNFGTLDTNTFSSDFQTCSNLQSFESGFGIDTFTATQLSGFKYRYSYDDSDGWQWGFCVQNSVITSLGNTPPNCDAVVTAPADGETGVDILPTINWSAATGFPDGYLVSIGTTDGGTDVLDSFDVGNALTFTVTADLAFETIHFVTITPYNGTGNATGCTSSSFETLADPQQTVDCTAGTPINIVYCYQNNDTTFWQFTSNDGSPLRFTFNSGTIEGFFDFVTIYEGTNNTGAILFQSSADFGNIQLAGVQVDSVGDSIFVEVDSDGSVSCGSGAREEWDFTVSCATCVNPIVEYTLIEDCDNGEQFIIEANITDLGSATSLDVTDDQASAAQTANAPGIITMGPYPNGTVVIVSTTNNDDGNCVINSSPLTQAACPPDNDLCVNATPIACGESDTGNTSAATEPDAPAGFCGTGVGAPGVWYEFTGNDMIVTASLCNSTFDTKIQVYEGSCDALTCIVGEDDDFGNCGSANPQVDFIANVGTTYYIYVFGFGANVGEYTIDVTCIDIPTPPANDECADATVFLANEGGDCVEFGSGTIFGATASGETNNCVGTADDDVWFEFVAVSENHAIQLNNIVGDTQDLVHVLYEGDDCTNLTELVCSDPNQSIANGLTIGNTYKVRVYSWTGNPLQDVSFDICVFTIPPPIYVSTTDFTVEELVNDVLVDSECNLVFNISSSTGIDFNAANDNGIGYFERNGSDFPFERGLILTTGNADDAPGPEDEVLSGGAWPGDADLENVIPSLAPGDTNDATIIQFDFIPVIDNMSFDFIFAAEEYGTFQCGFSDSFAFLLTDTNGVTTNLAIVPGTVDPISVFTVRDNTHNGGCDSVNPEFFDTFYGATGESTLVAPIDFRGHTVIMTASADVIPNELYTIKLVIADALDGAFDSAVFLGAGSFDIGDIDLGDDILLTSGNANCEGDVVVLDAGEIPNNSTLNWFQDGVEIAGTENQQAIEVGVTAFYRADISINGTDCVFMDEILIEFFPNPEPSFDVDSIIKCANEDFTLQVNIDNDGVPNLNDLNYQWALDGVDIVGATDSSYLLTIAAEEQGTFTVTVTDSVTGCDGSAEIFVEFYENANCVDVPQGLSPNGDGDNDCLVLDHLEDREDIRSINVFNRYGTKVFELSQYVDQWCGTDDDGELLPVGTYFYTIFFNSDKKPITSWIYLNY